MNYNYNYEDDPRFRMFEGIVRLLGGLEGNLDCGTCECEPAIDCCLEDETPVRESTLDSLDSAFKIKFSDVLNDVKEVIFNDPATIVTFSDGSKVCVKACSKDTFNKETGLIYAIVKRLYADDVEKKTGYLRSVGLGEKISKLVANATDQQEAKKAAAKNVDEPASAKQPDEKKVDEKKVDERQADGENAEVASW